MVKENFVYSVIQLRKDFQIFSILSIQHPLLLIADLLLLGNKNNFFPLGIK